MEAIRRTMETIIDKPVTFLFLTVGVYLIVLALIAVAGYVIACTQNAKTEMTGTMRVGISLNMWFESGLLQDGVEMEYGSLWIPMKQPTGADGLAPAELNWKEKAACRRYKVSTMLRRYLTAFKATGLCEDPSARLLEKLLEKDAFCDALGSFCFRGSKSGLTVVGTPDAKRGSDKKKVRVYCKLDGSAFEAVKTAYRNATECDVQTICVSLEYQT
ncbi:MAG TPA: hypothetical protein DDY90_07295 [Clostridiales bacterium]|nr:hypothetical protein [Clostridiales bacterium]